MVLAAETIEHEVFPGLKLNGIIDVNFSGFIKVVDTLGCAYVNVDHRYFNLNIGSTETNYSEINLQPGYQKLCYENALDYVRYRHTDSDFVRVARQQDFLRDLREQISPENALGQIDTVAKAVGTRDRHRRVQLLGERADRTRQAGRVLADQSRCARSSSGSPTETMGSRRHPIVTTTPDARAGHARGLPARPAESSACPSPAARESRPRATAITARASSSAAPIGLYPTPPRRRAKLVKAAVNVPFPVLYPSLQTGPAEQQPVRAYTLRDTGQPPPPRLRRASGSRTASAATTTSRAPTG